MKLVTNKAGVEHLCISEQHCGVSFLNESVFERIIWFNDPFIKRVTCFVSKWINHFEQIIWMNESMNHSLKQVLCLKLNTSLLYCMWKTVRQKNSQFHKTVGEKYPDDLGYYLHQDLHSVDTLLSHEATGENLWMAMKWHLWRCRSHDHINIADIVCLNFPYTTHIHTTTYIKCTHITVAKYVQIQMTPPTGGFSVIFIYPQQA